VRIEFPKGFWWGAATSAHQVEGGNTASDWWRAEQRGTVRFPSGRAAEQYTRYESDFDLAVELGHNAHRISIEWARIEPARGTFDADQIQHYVAVLSALKSRGLTTFLTLHHFTNPAWFADIGGWESREASALFERYVRAIVPALAEYVDVWLTINEPTTVPQQGYIAGAWPPHKRLAARAALRVIDAQADAHKLAYRAIHSLVPNAIVGYTATFINWRPKNPRSRWQQFLARKLAELTNFRFSDRVAGEHDLIGVQYYFTLPVGWRPYGPGAGASAETSDLGWEIAPEGLGEVTRAAWERYGKPIVITENGLADAADSRREAFIREHLRALRGAMASGADVRGYLYWSLIDNFEWAFGYEPRFGLVAVDYATQERTVRASAWSYKRIIEEGGFE
jgi:beta-glucosidase